MKAILLNSGGIDSLVAGRQMLDDHGDTGWAFSSLHVRNMRSPHAENAAKESARILGLPHEVLKTEYTWDWWYENVGGALVHPAGNIGTHFNAYQWCIFNRVTVMYSGLKPDLNSQEWMGKLKDLLYGTMGAMNNPDRPRPLIHFPLEGWNTSMDEVVARARDLGLPVEHTVSCNHSPACGRCGRCRDRARLGIVVQ